MTYYLYIDGEEVAYTDAYGSGAEEIFDDVTVAAGESVSVRVEAEVEAYGSLGDVKDVYLFLGGVDEFGKDVQYAKARLMTIKVKDAGSAKIEATTARNTVLRSSSNATLAEFTVKPANADETVKLDELTIALSGAAVTAGLGGNIFILLDIC